jgi:hypothetical protein
VAERGGLELSRAARRATAEKKLSDRHLLAWQYAAVTELNGGNPPRGAIGDQACDEGAAGLVGVEDLAEEDPEVHQLGVVPIVPRRLDLAEVLVEAVGGEDVGKGEAALLEELAAECIELMAEHPLEGSRIVRPRWVTG